MFKIFKKLKTFGSSLGGKLRKLFSKPLSPESLEELEQLLYEADLGSKCVEECIARIDNHYRSNKNATTDDLIKVMEEWAEEVLSAPPKVAACEQGAPHVILVVGINGSGKTTSCAKLAAYHKKQGKKVLLAAGDTFRAAAVEQLTHWANKIGVDIVKGKMGGDPSSVIYDALAKAKAGDYDIVICDTAGRLESKTDLMKELKKTFSVCEKLLNTPPSEIILTIDSTIGGSAVEQVKIFNTYTPLTGLILTKADGSARGGIVLAIFREFGIPVRYVGTGEGAADFKEFHVLEYVSTLFVD